jgi:hypothetical protein
VPDAALRLVSLLLQVSARDGLSTGGAAAIREPLRLDSGKSNNLSVKLSRRVENGVLARQGERRATR